MNTQYTTKCIYCILELVCIQPSVRERSMIIDLVPSEEYYVYQSPTALIRGTEQLTHPATSRSELPKEVQERLSAVLVNVDRVPDPPPRAPPETSVEAEQRDLGDLGLLRNVLDGQDVAEVAARTLGEVLQRTVRVSLDDDLETDGSRAVFAGVAGDEPDVPVERKGRQERRAGERQVQARRVLTFRHTGS